MYLVSHITTYFTVLYIQRITIVTIYHEITELRVQDENHIHTPYYIPKYINI